MLDDEIIEPDIVDPNERIEAVHGEVLPAVRVVTVEEAMASVAELQEARRQGGLLIRDLEAALNLVRRYKEILATPGINVPDPNHASANDLLRKYGLPTVKGTEGYGIFAEGTDITEHPDSIEASSVEEIPAITTVELVGDEEGNMGFIGQRSEVPAPRSIAEPDVEPRPEIPAATRDWLSSEPQSSALDVGHAVSVDPGPSWTEPRLATAEEVAAAADTKRVGAFAQRRMHPDAASVEAPLDHLGAFPGDA